MDRLKRLVVAGVTGLIAGVLLAAAPGWAQRPPPTTRVLPDLTIRQIELPLDLAGPDTTYTPGETLRLTVSVFNRGIAPVNVKPAPVIQVLMRERPSGGVARGRWFAIGSDGVARVEPDHARRVEILAHIPGDTDHGQYQLMACADYRNAIQESDERNNCRTLRPLVTIGGPEPANIVSTTPSPVFFGNVVVGGPVSFYNAGGQRSGEIGPVTVSDDPLGDFGLTNDQCSSRSLGPGQGESCQVEVVFLPKAGPADRSARLVLPAPGAANNGVVVGLYGHVPSPFALKAAPGGRTRHRR